jgi:D-proline reductase (dithiol) PrdB
MDLFARLHLWKWFGKITNSRWGVRFIDHYRKFVEAAMKPFAAGSMPGPPPLTPFHKSLEEARVALITTTGVNLEGQQPFDVDAPLGDFTYRAIPSDVETSQLRIAHTHYPHERAEQDINVIFPVERLRELAEEGAIGSVASQHYNFGFDLHVRELVDPSQGTAHQVAKALKEDGVDAVLFTPG